MIELQQGVIYKTKIGAKVTIKGVDETGIYPFLANVEFIDTSYYSKKITPVAVGYNPYGVSNRKFRGFDIVSEWNASDDLPEYEWDEVSFAGSVLEKEIKLNYSNESKNALAEHIKCLLLERKSMFWTDALNFINNDLGLNKWRKSKRFETRLSEQGDSAEKVDRATLREIFDVMDKEEENK